MPLYSLTGETFIQSSSMTSGRRYEVSGTTSGSFSGYGDIYRTTGYEESCSSTTKTTYFGYALHTSYVSTSFDIISPSNTLNHQLNTPREAISSAAYFNHYLVEPVVYTRFSTWIDSNTDVYKLYGNIGCSFAIGTKIYWPSLDLTTGGITSKDPVFRYYDEQISYYPCGIDGVMSNIQYLYTSLNSLKWVLAGGERSSVAVSSVPTYNIGQSRSRKPEAYSMGWGQLINLHNCMYLSGTVSAAKINYYLGQMDRALHYSSSVVRTLAYFNSGNLGN